MTATQSASAEPLALAETLTFDGVDFSREGTGELKARALLTSVTICEFAKYTALVKADPPGPRLLVLLFARKLSADQLQQVFRGVVQGRSDYSAADLEAFLRLLPSVRTGSVVKLRSDPAGRLAVFADNTPVGTIVAPQLAAALWAGLAADG
jgi:hypothetical protein